MISRYLAIPAPIGALLLTACATVDEQSQQALFLARHDWIAERTPPNTLWSHCNRTERARCVPTDSDPNTYQCSYREWAEHRPWPLKKATIRFEDDTWRWVDGDPPRCSITVIEE